MSLSEVRIDEIATMKYGKMPPKEILVDTGYPIYSGYRITGSAKDFLYKDPKLIVVARGVGGTGDVKISPSYAWITNLSIVLDLDNDRVDQRYLLYKLSREALKEKLNTGAAQAQITIDSLSSYRIRIPNIKIQKNIVSIISKYDDLIENNKRRIELLEESARQLYKEWFVRFRFPGHEHVKIIDGVPEGWTKKTLGDVCDLRAGGTFKLDYQGQTDGDIPFIKVRDMNSAGNTIFITESNNWVTKDQCFSFRGKPFSFGTCVFAKIGEALKKNRVRLIAGETLIDNNMMGATSKSTAIHFSLLYMKLKSFDFGSMSGGAAVPFLSAKSLSKEPILMPTEKLSAQFSDTSEPIFSQAANLQRQITELTKARDLLLPKLMNGEIVV